MTTRAEKYAKQTNSDLDKEAAKIAEFAKTHCVRKDWHEPDEQNVEALVVGCHLDNAFGDHIHSPREDIQEYVVVLNGPHGRATINLATLLAVAARAGGF